MSYEDTAVFIVSGVVCLDLLELSCILNLLTNSWQQSKLQPRLKRFYKFAKDVLIFNILLLFRLSMDHYMYRSLCQNNKTWKQDIESGPVAFKSSLISETPYLE